MPYYSNMTTAASASFTIWSTWASEVSGSTPSTTADHVWYTWTSQDATGTTSYRAGCVVTQEQAEEDLKRRREHLKAEEKKRKLAKWKAYKLLWMFLDPDQKKEFREHRHFHVVGGSSGRKYRVRENGGSTVANIDVYNEEGNKIIHRIVCIPMRPSARSEIISLLSCSG